MRKELYQDEKKHIDKKISEKPDISNKELSVMIGISEKVVSDYLIERNKK